MLLRPDTSYYDKYWDQNGTAWRLRATFVASAVLHVSVALAWVFFGGGQPAPPPIQVFDVEFVAEGPTSMDLPLGSPKPAPAAPQKPKPAPPAPKPKETPPPPEEVKPKEPPKEPEKPTEVKKEPEKPKVPEKPKEPDKPKKTEKEPEKPKELPKKTADKSKVPPKKVSEPREPSDELLSPVEEPTSELPDLAQVPTNQTGVAFGVPLPGPVAYWGGLVKAKVERVWTIPGGLRMDTNDNQAVIAFVVDREGNLLGEPQIVKQASDPELAESGLRAIRFAAPYPPLPESFRGQRQEVIYVFTLAP